MPDPYSEYNTGRVDYSVTCWHTGFFCPSCERMIMLTNGEVEWCGGCDYIRRCVRPLPIDEDDPLGFDGAGVA